MDILSRQIASYECPGVIGVKALLAQAPDGVTLQAPQVNSLAVAMTGTLTTTLGASTRLNWQWGDGQSDDQWLPAVHAYAISGTYPITATLYNTLAVPEAPIAVATAVATVSRTLPITPTAGITLTLQPPHLSGLAVTMSGTVTTTSGTIARLNWQWGDGASDDQWFPASHTYAISGTYPVTATAYNSVGTIQVATATAYAYPACSTGQAYGSFPTSGSFDGIPAARHPDKNLAVRGYALDTSDSLGISSVGTGIQAYDPTAPQLNYLLAPPFLPTTAAHVYQVHDWVWGPAPTYGHAGGLLSGVTLIGLQTAQGTQIHLPTRMPAGTGAVAVYNGTTYYGMVVYADPVRITVVYISFDNIVVPPGQPSAGNGYAVHIENFCVDPNLLNLYNTLNAAGRGSLPGLTYNQAMGVASSSEVEVAIVDSGTFMDPRIKAEWWHY